MKKLAKINECGARIVLASKSPRRQELLKNLKIEFEVSASEFDEKAVPADSMKPAEYAMTLASGKAAAVAGKLEKGRDAIVIGADTIVVLDGHVLGQPDDAKDAARMLRMLSGRANEVVTGVAVIMTRNGEMTVHGGFESTLVYFRKLTDADIESYIATGEPMDKAGAYGIQGFASLFVEKIEGCYFNVVGLPVMRLSKLIAECGISII